MSPLDDVKQYCYILARKPRMNSPIAPTEEEVSPAYSLRKCACANLERPTNVKFHACTQQAGRDESDMQPVDRMILA